MQQLKKDITINEILENEKITLSELAENTKISISLLSKIRNNNIIISNEIQKRFNNKYKFYRLVNDFSNEIDKLKKENTELKKKITQQEKELFLKGIEIEDYKSKFKILYEVLKELK